jgi:hypothetical protein
MNISFSRAALLAALASSAFAQNDTAKVTNGPAVKLPGAPQSLAGVGQIYSNGPYVNSAPNLSVLQNQAPPVSLGMTVLGFNGNRAFFTLLDDFTVTDPVGWRVDQLEVYGYQTSSGNVSTMNGIYVQIWNGDPTVPTSQVIWGDLVTNRLASTTWSGNYRVTETTLTATNRPLMAVRGNVGRVLPPGTYWVEYAITGTTASGPFLPPITITGTAATGNALQRTLATNAFAPMVDGATGAPRQGMPFLLIGDTMTPPCYETSLGTALNLTDDQTVARPLGFTFPFPGGSTTSIGICSNGFIWLDSTQTSNDFSATVAEFLGSGQAAPRLTPCWRDFNPDAAGSDDVYLNTFSDRAVITWHNVVRFGGTTPMTVQCQILSNGSVYYFYDGNIDGTGGTFAEGRSLIGIKGGVGAVADPGNTDYTAALPISTTVPNVYEFIADSVNFDLRNRCIAFTLNATNGYDVAFRTDCGASLSTYGVGCPAGTPLTLAGSGAPVLGTTSPGRPPTCL